MNRLIPKLFLTWLLGMFVLQVGLAEAQSEPPERIVWQKTPIALELRVGTERLVHFPGAVQVGVPAPLQDLMRIQNIAGTLYLLAHQPFAPTRVVVRSLDGGRIYLLDVSAQVDSAGTGPIEIFHPDAARGERETVPPENTRALAYGYVTLTRFAAQQLYAPARLLNALPGVVRVPVKREPVTLVRGATLDAVPLIAWRAGDRFVTAVTLTNTTRHPQILDPRTLRGRWLTATFQHNRVHAAGSEADRTVVYLISARPFAASL